MTFTDFIKEVVAEIRDFKQLFPCASRIIMILLVGIAAIIFMAQRQGTVFGDGEAIYYTRYVASPFYHCVLVMPTEHGLGVGASSTAISCVARPSGPRPGEPRAESDEE